MYGYGRVYWRNQSFHSYPLQCYEIEHNFKHADMKLLRGAIRTRKKSISIVQHVLASCTNIGVKIKRQQQK